MKQKKSGEPHSQSLVGAPCQYAVTPALETGDYYGTAYPKHFDGSLPSFESFEAAAEWLKQPAEPRQYIKYEDDTGKICEDLVVNRDLWCDPLPIRPLAGYQDMRVCGQRFRDFLTGDSLGATPEYSLNQLWSWPLYAMPAPECVLGHDWSFEEIEQEAKGKPGHLFFGRSIKSLTRQIWEAVCDMEVVLWDSRPSLSPAIVADFWNSVQVDFHFRDWCGHILAQDPNVKRQYDHPGLWRTVDDARLFIFKELRLYTLKILEKPLVEIQRETPDSRTQSRGSVSDKQRRVLQKIISAKSEHDLSCRKIAEKAGRDRKNITRMRDGHPILNEEILDEFDEAVDRLIAQASLGR